MIAAAQTEASTQASGAAPWPARPLGPDMNAKHRINAFNTLLGNDTLGALGNFFTRLENQSYRAMQFAPDFIQDFSGTQQHCRMGIMTAGMHEAVIDGFERYVRLFGNGQGIHIGPQTDGLSRKGPFDYGNDT